MESNQNMESKTKNVESKITFGQLILRKLIKTVASKCQILRLKCTKIQNSAGAPPRPRRGSLQRSPDPLAGFKGLLLRRGKVGEGVLWSTKKILKIDPGINIPSSY